MLQTLVNVFRIAELRNKVLFTLAMLAVFRIGHWVPLPGVNQESLRRIFEQSESSGSAFAKLANFVSIFSGGGLSHSTIFGLGIMPYITAGIVFQLMATVIPRLKKLQEEGPTGRQKIMEWTRYATVGLCIVQGMFWLRFLTAPGQDVPLVYPEWVSNPMWWMMSLAALTAGTIFLMWLGEQIDKFGIGNGVSMIIMAGIVADLPSALIWVLGNSPFAAFGFAKYILGDSVDPNADPRLGWMGVILLAAGFVFVVGGSVLMTVAQRRIPVQQAKHTRGRRVFGGQRSYLPLRINHGGVMPIIFASSLMVFPTVIFTQLREVVQARMPGTVWDRISVFLSQSFDSGAFLYVVLYILMVYFFSYFWITVQFNPEEMSKQLKENGSFIPGLRPGPRTAEYLETVMGRVTFVGAGFLAVIAVLPMVIHHSMQVDFRVSQFLGGTGLLIVVSVMMDFLQRVEANLLMRNYAGFLGSGEDAKGPKFRGPRG